MYNLRLGGVTANQALQFCQMLKDDGLVLNLDFEWHYHPSEVLALKYVVFGFARESLASFYALKWQSTKS
jgi:hypothetical protein